VKRRPASTVFEGIEMLEGSSKPKSHNRSISGSSHPPLSHLGPDFTSTPPQIFTVLVDHPPNLISPYSHVLPDGAEPPVNQYYGSLNRNSSSSTAASTASPMTEESAMVSTPDVALMMGKGGVLGDDVWSGMGLRDALGLANTVEGEGLSNLDGAPSGTEKDNHPLIPSAYDVYFPNTDSIESGIPRHPPSPTASHTHSSLTTTPTVSSGSTARARHTLRHTASVSDLNEDSQRSEIINSPISRTPKEDSYERRPSVTFDSLETDTEHSSISTRRGLGFRTRPPLVRLRSSSLGDRRSRMRSNSTGGISTVTNSVYSIGEIITAEGAVLSPARTIRFGDMGGLGSAREIERAEYLTRHVGDVFGGDDSDMDHDFASPSALDTVATFMGSSAAVRRAFELDEGAEAIQHPSSSRPAPRNRKSSHVHRPLPVAPHLAYPPSPSRYGIPIPPSLPPTPRPVRPGLQPRQSSISRLWRRMSSTGGKKRDTGSSSGDHGDSTPSSDGSSPTIPLVPAVRRAASRNVVDPVMPIVTSPKPILAVTTSSTTTTKQVGKRLSKGKQPAPSLTSTKRAQNRVNQYDNKRYVDGEDISREFSWEQINIPTRDSSLKRQIPSRSSSMASVPIAARVPEPSPPLRVLDDAEGYLYAIRGSSSRTRSMRTAEVHDLDISTTSSSIIGSPIDSPTIEQRRKYRQTLVEIKDDHVFQQVLEDLARLETARLAGVASGETTPIMPVMLRTPSGELLEKKARQESIRAWFVTRELVQGERRYGRLLARGVSVSVLKRDEVGF
jgi:hypothetical protein